MFSNFEGACLKDGKHSLVSPTLPVFLMMQVTFLPQQIECFLARSYVSLSNDGFLNCSRNNLVKLKNGGFYPVRALFLVENTNQFKSCFKKAW